LLIDNLSVLRNFGREGDPNRKVLVFDDFPTVRRQKTRWQGPARVHPRPEPWRCCLPSSTVAIVTDSTKIAAVPAAPTAVANVQKSARAGS
jgi:jasmonate ZIM domain-containing protein